MVFSAAPGLPCRHAASETVTSGIMLSAAFPARSASLSTNSQRDAWAAGSRSRLPHRQPEDIEYVARGNVAVALAAGGDEIQSACRPPGWRCSRCDPHCVAG